MVVGLLLRVLALVAATDAFTFYPLRSLVASRRHCFRASRATTMLQAHSSDETRRQLLQKTASAFVAIATGSEPEVALAADSMSPEAARAQWNAAMQKLNELDEKYEAAAAVSELQRKCTYCTPHSFANAVVIIAV